MVRIFFLFFKLSIGRCKKAASNAAEAALESRMKKVGEKAGEYASDNIFPKKPMGKIITEELIKEETPKTPRDPYLKSRLFGRGNERIKKVINRRKKFDYDIVMFRSTKYCNRLNICQFNLAHL